MIVLWAVPGAHAAVVPIGHPGRMTVAADRRSAPALPALGLLSAAVVLGLTVRFALLSGTGQQWDDDAMSTVYAGREARLTVLSVLGRVSIGLVLLVSATCVVAALLRGRLDLALGALVVVGGANVTTQLLKHTVIDRPDFGLGTSNSLPSGHTTVVASAVAAAVLVAPSALRGLLALGGAAATTLTGASTIVASWHRPADIVAALAVALGWVALVALVLRGRWSASSRELVSAAVGAGAGLVALVAIGVRPVTGWSGFAEAAVVLGAVAAVTALFVAAVCAVAPRESQ